ncbi:MAG: hypothetical protein K6U12_08695 [Armatimonadetes bacterium]|nr:hypothetical protein [Armatimonadota bacterium]CUU37398.1 hypothetical protein DCOP10_1201 [Armatimonadetes bacterium DC]
MRRLMGIAVAFFALIMGVAVWIYLQYAPPTLPENLHALPEKERVTLLVQYALSHMYAENWLTRLLPPRHKVPVRGYECVAIAGVVHAYEIDPREVPLLDKFARSLQERSQRELIYAYLGATCARLGQEQRAQKYLREITDPALHRLILLDLAAHYAAQGQRERALTTLKRVFSRPNLPVRIRLLYFSEEDEYPALERLIALGYHREVFETLAEDWRFGYSWMRTALLASMARAGKFREIESLLSQLHEPKRSDAHLLLALHALEKGRLQEALTHMRQTAPQSLDRVVFVDALEKHGHRELAKRFCEEVYEEILRMPARNPLREYRLAAFAVRRARAGDMAWARRALSQVRDTRFRLGVRAIIALCYLSQGDWDAFRREFQLIKATDFGSGLTVAALLQHLREGQTAKAREILDGFTTNVVWSRFVAKDVVSILQLTPADKKRIARFLNDWAHSRSTSSVQAGFTAQSLMLQIGAHEDLILATMQTPPPQSHPWLIPVNDLNEWFTNTFRQMAYEKASQRMQLPPELELDVP